MLSSIYLKRIIEEKEIGHIQKYVFLGNLDSCKGNFYFCYENMKKMAKHV